jgi:hypothetical protein
MSSGPQPLPDAYSSLAVPGWVPHPVSIIAQRAFADASARPPDILREYTDATVRLATDPRMSTVWNEFLRRSRTPTRKYVHPARKRNVNAWRNFDAVRELARSARDHDRLQEQACTLLFMEATSFFLWDQRRKFGPRAVTVGEIAQERRQARNLAQQIRIVCEQLKAAGMWQCVSTLEQAAKSLDMQAQVRSHPKDPYIVQRRSRRLGDDWVRGFIITLAGACRALFGRDMLSTITTITNVAFARNDLTIGKARGVILGTSERPRKRHPRHHR